MTSGERRCSSCGQVATAPSARWCGTCGASLTPAAPAGGPATDPRTAGGDVEGRSGTSARARPVLVLAGVAVVALVAVVVAGSGLGGSSDGGALEDDAVIAEPAAGDDDADDDGDDEGDGVPVCLDAGRDCVVWLTTLDDPPEADDADGRRPIGEAPPSELLDPESARLTYVGDTATVTLVGERLVGLDTVSGEVRWRAALTDVDPARPSFAPLGDELVVHLDGQELVGRDRIDGTERWRADGQELHRIEAAIDADGTALVQGRDRDGRQSIVAVDAVDGSPRWSRSGDSARLVGPSVFTDPTATTSADADEAVAVVLGDDQVVALGVAGDERWRADGSDAVWANPFGPLVILLSDRGTERFLHLEDGTSVPTDAGDRLLGPFDGGNDPGATVIGSDGSAALVEAGAVAWQVEVPDVELCTAALTPTTVELSGCDGATVTLDRDDGRELDRDDPTTTDAPFPFLTREGAPQLNVEGRGTGGTVLRWMGAPGELVRLPPDSFPVWTGRDAGDGPTVVRGPGYVAALRLPPPPDDLAG